MPVRMRSVSIWLVCAGLLIVSPLLRAAEDLVPAYVESRKILDILTDFHIANASEKPFPQVGLPTEKRLLHVYGKGLEMLEKIAKLQTDLELEVVSLPALPQQTDGEQIKVLLERVQQQLRTMAVAREVVISAQDYAPSGKVSITDLYANLRTASLLMDVVFGEPEPVLIYTRGLQILNALEIVASNMGHEIDKELPRVGFDVEVREAHLDAYKSLHKLLRLERKLGIKPLRVESYPLGQPDIGSLGDATNILLMEFAHIQTQLGLSAAPAVEEELDRIRTEDLVAVMQAIDTNFDRLLEAS